MYPGVKDQDILDAYHNANGNQTKAAKMVGMPRKTYTYRLGRIQTLNTADGKIEIDVPPPELIPVEDLVEERKRKFAQREAHEKKRKLITVRVKEDRPIGLLHFGDPHVDDNGTDIGQLETHSNLTQTDGVYGCNVGDTTNNWVGRLARLFAEQSTSSAEAWELAGWFIERTNWLYIVGGNHDEWSGAGDPLRWIAKQVGTLYQSSDIRMGLRFSNKAQVRINARHNFAGHSQYNTVHGQAKNNLFGVRDHIAIAGHTHTSGHGIQRCPQSGIAMHAVQVASYKIFDMYSRQKGFLNQTLSPCAFTTINPRLDPTHPDLIKLFWDPEEGVEYLKFLRRRFK